MLYLTVICTTMLCLVLCFRYVILLKQKVTHLANLIGSGKKCIDFVDHKIIVPVLLYKSHNSNY